MVKQFRDLEVVKNFVHKDKAKILEYIEMMYSQTSKLNKIEDVEERRRQAAKLSGLDSEDSDVYDIILLKHEEVNELIYHFHTRFNTNKYHLLCTYQNLLWAYQRRISKMYIDIDEADDKTITLLGKLSDECDTYVNKIQRLINEIFATKEVIDMAEVVSKKMMTPESRLRLSKPA